MRPAAELADRIRTRLTWVGITSNTLGAVVVCVFLFIAPTTVDRGASTEVTLWVLGLLVVLSTSLARLWLLRLFAPIDRWLRADSPPTERERQQVLRYPASWSLRLTPFWTVAALTVGLLWSSGDIDATSAVAAGTTTLGALTAGGLQYLLVERTLRPVTARALADGPPPQWLKPGVATRLTVTWSLATGVPLLGIVALTAGPLTGAEPDRVIGATLFLALLGIGVGFFAARLAARSVADPLTAVRAAMERVGHGDVAARVDIDDGSEVGLLQDGFNRMAAGLQERDQIRTTLGTYLDTDVADHILSDETDLTGEEIQTTIVFIDVRGFTALTERLTATDVVRRLNRLFEGIVPIIHAHGGHVDKFVGDGILAVFGAPRRQRNHAGQALAASIAVRQLVEQQPAGDLRVGIGLDSGTVVAGNVGGGGRFEFTVIGDAVNVAARVEACTRQTGDAILVSERTTRLLGRSGNPFLERPNISLKGKQEAVRIYALRPAH